MANIILSEQFTETDPIRFDDFNFVGYIVRTNLIEVNCHSFYPLSITFGIVKRIRRTITMPNRAILVFQADDNENHFVIEDDPTVAVIGAWEDVTGLEY